MLPTILVATNLKTNIPVIAEMGSRMYNVCYALTLDETNMPAWITQPNSGTNTNATISPLFSRIEIVEAWNSPGQGHCEAVARGPYCFVVSCTREMAVELSALFIRRMFAIPHCATFDGLTFSFYMGETGRPHKKIHERAGIIYDEYLMSGGDEWAPLYRGALGAQL